MDAAAEHRQYVDCFDTRKIRTAYAEIDSAFYKKYIDDDQIKPAVHFVCDILNIPAHRPPEYLDQRMMRIVQNVSLSASQHNKKAIFKGSQRSRVQNDAQWLSLQMRRRRRQ